MTAQHTSQPQGSPSAHQGHRMETEPRHLMRRFEVFDLWAECWRSHPRESWTKVEVYRTKSGDYITGRHRGRRPGLVKAIARLKITAEISSPEHHTVCSIGRSSVDGKWYGWSHRAMVGFGVGDAIFDEMWGMCDICKSEGSLMREFREADITNGSREEPACQGGLCAELGSMLFTRRGGDVVKTDAEAKRAASNFAAYIS